MRNRTTRLMMLATLLLVVGSYVVWQQRQMPASAPQSPSKPIPKGPAPVLPVGFPPVFPGAKLDDVTSKTDSNGWQRTFIYTMTAGTKAADIVAYFRKELPKSVLQIMAEGAGPYGAMLRAQSPSMKRLVLLEVDAPEDRPKDPVKINVSVVDTP